MILHRVEPGRTADDEMIPGEAPCLTHPAARIRVRAHRIDVDAVHDDSDTVASKSASDRVGAHRTRVGDGEIGAPGKPSFGAIGEGVQRVILIELHSARPQPEDEFAI